MRYELEPMDQEMQHCIYLDIRLYRLLISNETFWDNFFLFFETHYPSLFYDFNVIFSWQQVLEERNLGDIITIIKNHPDWRPSPKEFNSNDIEEINKCLDSYFETAKKIATKIDKLQPEFLRAEIDKAIASSHSKATPLIASTLLKIKKIIESGDYMGDLTDKIAWALITSHEFIKPTATAQYEERKKYFDPLISGWHKLFISGTELDWYRIIDRKYHADNLHQKSPKIYDKNTRIKSQGDLVDSELIHYITFGEKRDDCEKRVKVIAITEDNIEVLKDRVGISKQMLIALQRDVVGWCAKPVPGEIISLEIKNKEIIKAKEVKYSNANSDLSKY